MREISERTVFQGTLDLASSRVAPESSPGFPLKDSLSFLGVLDAFNSVVRDLGVENSTLQRICYQALLMMDAASESSWSEKLSNPDKYVNKKKMKMGMLQVQNENGGRGFDSSVSRVYGSTHRQRDDLERVTDYMSRSLLHTTGYTSGPMTVGSDDLRGDITSSSGHKYAKSTSLSAYSPLNNYFEVEEGAQMTPSYSQSRMYLNNRHHSPAKGSPLKTEEANSGAGDEDLLIKTFQGRHTGPRYEQQQHKPDGDSERHNFSDGLNYADSQALDNLTRRLYDLDRDRLEDTQYRLDQRGALLMSRFRERSNAARTATGTDTGAGAADADAVHTKIGGAGAAASRMKSEDLDRGVELALALNSEAVPAALRVRHAEAMERFRGQRSSMEAYSEHKSGERGMEERDGDRSALDLGASGSTTPVGDRSLRMADLSFGDGESPVPASSPPRGSVSAYEQGQELEYEKYDYEPGVSTNTANNRGGKEKASLFQSPSLATQRAERAVHGEQPHLVYRAAAVLSEYHHGLAAAASSPTPPGDTPNGPPSQVQVHPSLSRRHPTSSSSSSYSSSSSSSSS